MVTPLTANGRLSFSAMVLSGAALAASALALAASAHAAPPRIRTDSQNTVPRCVTPKRLMAFLRTRNSDLDARFADIAALYKKHGEAWRVRWDYAFFQMVVETNFLTFRKGDGGWGDVRPKQNNFAGLGTTGGGVPGDSYPNPSTGVLAQIQHLVVYSGERIGEPVGARTRLKQDDILAAMASKKGKATFADLSRRWAADRHYGASIEWVASKFREGYCKGPEPAEDAATPPTRKPAVRRTAGAKQELAAAANLGGPPPREAQTEEGTAPVRTIWSAADGPAASPASEPAATTPAAIEPPAAGTAEVIELAPVPTRKPESGATAEVVAEQVVQTGDASPVAAREALASQAAPPAQINQQPPASTPGAPPAFAYAAAMGNLLPKPAPQAATATGCRVGAASYGGKKVLLVQSTAGAETRYTVLTVLEGFEKSMLDSYLKAHAPGGQSVGEFASKDAALAKARELCPGAAVASPGEGASAG
jgi:hypothetical protein